MTSATLGRRWTLDNTEPRTGAGFNSRGDQRSSMRRLRWTEPATDRCTPRPVTILGGFNLLLDPGQSFSLQEMNWSESFEQRK